MKVEIAPYNPEWINLYKSEAELLVKTCGQYFITIEHAGSTSVPGLAAKPVVDIYIGVKSLADADKMIPFLTELGYNYIKEFEKELPFRRYFRKNVNGVRTYNIHVTPASHPFRRDDLMFRDYLTINENAKKEYEKLKINLAENNWTETDSYTKAKTELCLNIKNEALKYFSVLYEKTESEAVYLRYTYASDDARKKAGFSMFREKTMTGIRMDVSGGFPFNRTLGIGRLDNEVLDKIENFYNGKDGIFALQIPPFVLDEERKELITNRGFSYANSWITFYRDTSPVNFMRGTDVEIKEISAEYSAEFARNLNEIFSFPRKLDDICASTFGKKEWITFMAFDGSKSAGAASVCITGETANLSFAHVLPEYRRRGIQCALLTKRIDAARERGAKWITVDTTENSGENPDPSYWNVLRHGFRLLYHRPNYVKNRGNQC